MTVEMCQVFCASKNYGLAGIEYSTQCYCGLDLAPGYAYGQTGCTMPCAGDASEICGGKSRLSVYRNTTYATPVIPQSVSVGDKEVDFQGCFTDSSTARLLSRFTWTSTTLVTVEACAAKCASRGYGVSGTEHGGECYCGDAVPSSSNLTDVWNCGVSFCSGNASEFCGGNKALAVYA